MSKKLSKSQTREFLESVALPNHGGRYTPISHKSIIDKVHDELAKRGYEVESELYRSNVIGTVANGIYILTSGSDPDMKMMLAWGNSYDKSMKFVCGIGAYIPTTETMIFAGELSNYMRKHTGKADSEVLDMISLQLNDAMKHYTNIIESRDTLQTLHITLPVAASLLGRLYAELEYLGPEQASAVKNRLVNKTALIPTLPWDNAWNYYMSVTSALRGSHPKSWFQDHAGTHKFIMDSLGNKVKDTTPAPELQIPVSNVDPKQISLFDIIAEVEEEQAIEKEETDEIAFIEIPDTKSDDAEEQIGIDMYLEQRAVREEVNPDQDFFDLGKSETFSLPDL